jgi:hypothetical protein
MVRDSSVPVVPQPEAVRQPSHRQRWRRQRSRRLTLRIAVRHAVDVFFRFTHRDTPSKSMWSATERVWLGRTTFLNWSLRDPEIDIPWVVARAAGAPPAADDLVEAVRDELTAYWTVQSECLPSERKPRWLPLP